jgi:hypothetical protein
VRLIKTIGDAAMFVSPEAEPLVEVALALLAAVEEAELPSLRAGIALGPAVIKAGDYYGPSVNLASRVTGVARPGTVLCTQEVHDAAQDGGLHWSAAGRHRFKGISGPVALYRARREPEPGTESPEGSESRADSQSPAGSKNPGSSETPDSSESPESSESSRDSGREDGAASPRRRAGRSRRRGRH